MSGDGISLKKFSVCIRCDGTGNHIECYDDLCHAKGRCIHGENTCALCHGHRMISEELAEKWRTRDAFETVELPEQDKQFRGIDTETSLGSRGGSA